MWSNEAVERVIEKKKLYVFLKFETTSTKHGAAWDSRQIVTGVTKSLWAHCHSTLEEQVLKKWNRGNSFGNCWNRRLSCHSNEGLLFKVENHVYGHSSTFSLAGSWINSGYVWIQSKCIQTVLHTACRKILLLLLWGTRLATANTIVRRQYLLWCKKCSPRSDQPSVGTMDSDAQSFLR